MGAFSSKPACTEPRRSDGRFTAQRAEPNKDEIGDLENEEAAALHDPPGKVDGYGYEIVYAHHVNAHPSVGELASRDLIQVPTSELPGAHFEGRYALTEVTEEGERAREGFFNIYRYADRLWIRFYDDRGEAITTTYEKYSCSTFATPWS